MSECTRISTDTTAQSEERRGDARTRKTIRFSGPEWELIERAAAKRGVPGAEYVRMTALDAAEGKTAALTAEIIETIRGIYRSTYIVSTPKRDEMLREGRGEEMKKMIADWTPIAIAGTLTELNTCFGRLPVLHSSPIGMTVHRKPTDRLQDNGGISRALMRLPDPVQDLVNPTCHLQYFQVQKSTSWS